MKKIALSSFVLLLFLAGCSGAPTGGQSDEEAIAIAQCLSEKDVRFYGAFWCPHCSDQKKMFGSAGEKYLPYKECDSRGDNPVTEECLELKIESYPTWIFPDESRLVGAISVPQLQEKSGCTGEELAKYLVTETE